jgi:hypothetical protein
MCVKAVMPYVDYQPYVCAVVKFSNVYKIHIGLLFQVCRSTHCVGLPFQGLLFIGSSPPPSWITNHSQEVIINYFSEEIRGHESKSNFP